jgi:hypothetical protein
MAAGDLLVYCDSGPLPHSSVVKCRLAGGRNTGSVSISPDGLHQVRNGGSGCPRIGDRTPTGARFKPIQANAESPALRRLRKVGQASIFGGLARGSELWCVLPRCHAVGSITDGGFNVLRNRLRDLRRAEESAGARIKQEQRASVHRPAPERGQ